GTVGLKVRVVGADHYRVIKIISGESPGAVRRPAHAQFGEEIGRDFDDAGFDQHLGGGSVEFLDQFQDLREEVNVGLDEERIAALVGHGAHAAHKVADGPGAGAAILGSRIIGLAAEPGKVA